MPNTNTFNKNFIFVCFVLRCLVEVVITSFVCSQFMADVCFEYECDSYEKIIASVTQMQIVV